MMKILKPLNIFLGTMIIAFFCGANISAFAQADKFPDLPKGEGRDKIITHCTNCHSANRLTKKRRTKNEWQKVLETMSDDNDMLPLPDKDYDLILNYLAKYLGPKRAK